MHKKGPHHLFSNPFSLPRPYLNIPLFHASVEIYDLPFVIILFLCLRPSQNHLHGLVVVSLDLEVCYPAVALGGGNLAMARSEFDFFLDSLFLFPYIQTILEQVLITHDCQ